MSLIKALDRRFYPGAERNWDDWLFRSYMDRCCNQESTVLDLGAGSGIVTAMNIRGTVRHVCGIDPDIRVLENPFLDEAKVADGASIPYPSDMFTLVFADNVLEHLANPSQVFTEVARVLKPGGSFLFKTPNRWHYVALVAAFSPHWFHSLVNRWRGRPQSQFFPTLYRANSRQQIEASARRAGLAVQELLYIDGRPEYLRFSWPTYLLGIAYQRLVSGCPLLAPLRVGIIGSLRKPMDSAAG